MENVETKNWSFTHAWGQVKQSEVAAVKRELMDALHIISDPTFYRRMKGEVVPKPSEIAAIETVFANHGITQVWDA